MKILSWDIGIKNLSYCILESENKNNVKIIDWGIIDISPYNKKDSKNLYKIVKIMYSKLNDILEIVKECDVVLIENQPCMKNPIMKSIQILLYSYLHMKLNHIENKNESICMFDIYDDNNNQDINK